MPFQGQACKRLLFINALEEQKDCFVCLVLRECVAECRTRRRPASGSEMRESFAISLEAQFRLGGEASREGEQFKDLLWGLWWKGALKEIDGTKFGVTFSELEGLGSYENAAAIDLTGACKAGSPLGGFSREAELLAVFGTEVRQEDLAGIDAEPDIQFSATAQFAFFTEGEEAGAESQRSINCRLCVKLVVGGYGKKCPERTGAEAFHFAAASRAGFAADVYPAVEEVGVFRGRKRLSQFGVVEDFTVKDGGLNLLCFSVSGGVGFLFQRLGRNDRQGTQGGAEAML